MVGLNGPRPLGPRLKLADSHLQVVGCPVLRVSVCRDRPKHLDEPIALEMHPPAFRFDGNRADRHVAAPIGVDLSVGLEARQPRPIVGANPLEVVEGSIPAIEHHALGLKAARLGTGQHRPEVLVLVVAPDRLVIDAEVAGNASEAVRPDHTYEIDAQDHPVMFAAPMARHQFDPLGIGLVQGGIVQSQHAALKGDQSLRLSPQRLGIGRLSCEQAREGVMGWRRAPFRMTAGGLSTTEGALSGDQEVDVVVVCTLGWVHRTGSRRRGSSFYLILNYPTA